MTRRLKLDKKNALVYGLLCVLVFVWFYDAIFHKKIFAYSDLARYFYPLRLFAADAVKNGHIPLWNPYLKAGMPLFASLQLCVLYPISIIYYIIPSFDQAFNWYIIIHFLLGGIFMHTLMRYWNISRVGSLISALVFIFGGYLSSVIVMNTSLSSVIWLPLIVLFFDMTLKKRRVYPALLTTFFLSIQFLGGEPTIIYGTIIFLFFYYIYFSCNFYRETKDLKAIAKMFGLFLIAVTSWIFVTMVQLLPFAEFLLHSTRAHPKEFELVTHWSLLPGELLSFIIPYIFGNATVPGGYLDIQYWMASFYIGIMPLFLILFALFIRPERKKLFFGLMVMISFILALGRHTPVYKFLYTYLFGFGHIRYPVKFIFMASFALSILAGMGYDAFISMDKVNTKVRLARSLLLLNGLLGLLIVLFVRFWSLLYSHIVKSALFGKFSIVRYLDELSYVLLSDSAHFHRLFIIFTPIVLSMIFYLRGKIRLSVFNFLVVSIIFLDLISVNMGISKTVDRDIFRLEPPSFFEVKKDRARFRIMRTERLIDVNRGIWGPDYAIGQYMRKKCFNRNTPMIHGISDAQGYGSLNRKDYNEFIKLMYKKDTPFPSRLVDLLNVKYVISTEPIPGYDLIYKDTIDRIPIICNGDKYVYYYINKNDKYMERAFLVKGAKVVQNREDMLNILADETFDPAKEVLIEEEPKEFQKRPNGRIGTHRKPERVMILRYGPQEVIVEASLHKPRFLVMSDSYYPGWKVSVDGEPDKLYRAYYFLRAVHLDAGKHIVRFVYDPLSYKLGVIISVMTIILLLFFGAGSFLHRRLHSPN